VVGRDSEGGGRRYDSIIRLVRFRKITRNDKRAGILTEI
jgi:hypothetical protein